MGPAGLVAMLAGWLTTEIGRQPWAVYGVLRTKDAVSAHSAEAVGATLLLFVVFYLCIFLTGIYYMLRTVAQGPQANGPGGDDDQHAVTMQLHVANRVGSIIPIDPGGERHGH